MFDSGILVAELIKELQSEVDVALDIPDESYLAWLNSVEQLLYREVIKEQKSFTIDSLGSEGVIRVEDIDTATTANDVRFEDIHALYADERQLIKSTMASGDIFPDTFYKDDNNIHYSTSIIPDKIKIVYFVKPALKTVDTMAKQNVMVPIEFIEIIKSKLRGEAYKLANEESLAAKWLNDYNVLLETFKVWVGEKTATFGL